LTNWRKGAVTNVIMGDHFVASAASQIFLDMSPPPYFLCFHRFGIPQKGMNMELGILCDLAHGILCPRAQTYPTHNLWYAQPTLVISLSLAYPFANSIKPRMISIGYRLLLTMRIRIDFCSVRLIYRVPSTIKAIPLNKDYSFSTTASPNNCIISFWILWMKWNEILWM
jgi:hypothetical protein